MLPPNDLCCMCCVIISCYIDGGWRQEVMASLILVSERWHEIFNFPPR